MGYDRFSTGGNAGVPGDGDPVFDFENIYLNSLADVNVPTPTDGLVLTYDGATGKWVPSVIDIGTRTFTVSCTIKSPEVGYTTIWRAPIDCTCIKMEARQEDGTSMVINGRYNGITDVASSDLTLIAADTWYNTTGINQTAWSATDWLELRIVTLGSATEITFILTFTEP